MEIRFLQFTDIVNEVIKLTDKLMTMYGLSSPAEGFCNYLANVLKKHYSELTFEQINQAFEYNAIGSLNGKLPKTGLTIDNKVKFTIPDMNKIIKAYCQLKNIGPKEQQAAGITSDQVNAINEKWFKNLYEIFTHYRDTGTRGIIFLKVFTCNKLVELKLLDRRELIAEGASEDLIFKAFDDCILSGKDLIDYMINAEPASEMPF
jgi:hypothetical protein